MNLSFLALPREERRLYFEEAARQRNLSPILLEKDFWVCWLLGLLFTPVLLFHYPTIAQSGFEYLKRSVKLEFGSLTDQRPIGRHPIRPWLAEVFEPVFPDWACEVVALELERTFWEKATILHAEYTTDRAIGRRQTGSHVTMPTLQHLLVTRSPKRRHGTTTFASAW